MKRSVGAPSSNRGPLHLVGFWGWGTDEARKLRLLPGALVETLHAELGPGRPGLLVKLGHDLDDHELGQLAEAALEAGADGLVLGGGARRHGQLGERAQAALRGVQGAACGPPLLPLTLRRVADLRRRLGPRPVLIGCGGIMTGEDALRVMRAVADMVQILTALVYRGPAAPGLICRELGRALRRAGARSLAGVRGADL